MLTPHSPGDQGPWLGTTIMCSLMGLVHGQTVENSLDVPLEESTRGKYHPSDGAI